MNPKRSVAALLAAALLALPTLADEPAASGVTVASISLDPAFGTDGVVRAAGVGSTHLDGFSFARIDSKGRIVVAGATFTDVDSPLGIRLAPAVARFLADGTIDATFGSGGVVLAPLEVRSLEGLVLDADDGVVICGLFISPPRASFYPNVAAARFTPQGEFDATFRGNGQLLNHVLMCAHIAAAPDGSAYYVTQASERLETDGAVLTDGIVRIRADGTRDFGFGEHGLALTNSGVFAMAVDGVGRVVAASGDGLRRILPDGTRDPTFADPALADVNGVAVEPWDLSIDETGRILVYGTDGFFPQGMYRFLADGAPDTSFADRGFAPIRQAFPGDASPNSASFGAAGGRAALAGSLLYRDSTTGDIVGRGLWVQAFDPSRPTAVIGHLSPREASPAQFVNDVIVTPDGSALIVTGSTWENNAGTPFLMRIALDPETPRPVPNVAVAWKGRAKVSRTRHGVKLRARVTFSNTSEAPVANVHALVSLSSDDVFDPDDAQLPDVVAPSLGPGQSFTARVKYAARRHVFTRGSRLIARLDPAQRLPQASYAHDVAVSASIR